MRKGRDSVSRSRAMVRGLLEFLCGPEVAAVGGQGQHGDCRFSIVLK